MNKVNYSFDHISFLNAFRENSNKEIMFKSTNYTKLTDGFTVSFVWFEQKSWLVAGALFLFPMLAIQKRLGMITGLNHLTKKKKKN